jgi:CubicO group peptidase (beta-lactamase class C family)
MRSSKLRQQLRNIMGGTLVSLTLVAGCIAPLPPGAEPATPPDQTAAAAQTGATANGELYTDPAGRFSAPIPTNWTATAAEGHVMLRDPEGEIRVYLLALDNPDPEAAIAEAWQVMNPSLTLAVAQQQEQPATDGIDQIYFMQYENGPTGEFYQASARMVDGTAYLLLVDAKLEALQRRGAQVNIIDSGFTISGLETIDLAAVDALPVDETISAQLSDFIENGLANYGIPGAAVSVVQDGKVVYQETFGTTVLGGDAPITPQTHMMIGSTGKSLTTLLMATLVDAGLMTWDTPVVEVLPQFQVADETLTQSITMRNLVCACTGVPRRDLEVIFNAGELSAEDIVESLQTFEFFTAFGEAFQYSNQMVGTGGFATAAADGAPFGNLWAGYRASLARRVLQPLNMPNTTIAFDEVFARNHYALPHEIGFGAHYTPIKIADEKVLEPFAPAGTHWSTLEDMTSYLIMALNKGVTAAGSRVVSEENLLTTWQPQVPLSADASYGLGWFVSDYKGASLISHGGNTLGFTSDFAFLPEHGVGIVTLVNARGTNYFNQAVRARLFELVFAQEAAAGKEADFSFAQIKQGLVEPPLFAAGLEEATLAPYLGVFHNEALGSLTLTLTDGVLMADAGEFSMKLIPTEQAGKVHYTAANGLITGTAFTFAMNEAGKPTISFGEGVEKYIFVPVE